MKKSYGKIISLMLALLMTMSMTLQVIAVDVDADANSDTVATTEAQEASEETVEAAEAVQEEVAAPESVEEESNEEVVADEAALATAPEEAVPAPESQETDEEATPAQSTEEEIVADEPALAVAPEEEVVADEPANEASSETQNFVFTKKWNDNNNANKNRPSIDEFVKVITLKIDGKDYDFINKSGVTIEKNDKATVGGYDAYVITIKGLPAGKITASEGPIKGYEQQGESKSDPANTTNVTFTNTTRTNTTNTTFTFTKKWDDNNNAGGKRPNIEDFKDKVVIISIDSDGVEKDLVKDQDYTLDAKPDADGNYVLKFTKLRDDDDWGKTFKYEIKELNIEGYVAGDFASANTTNTTLTNTIKTVELIKVTKVWDDDDDVAGLRPEKITVNLLANGEQAGSPIELNASDNWAGAFENLPKYKDGQEIEYTITEEKVANYDEPVISGTAADGFTITNTLIQPTIDLIKVTKVWDDEDDAAGIRPEKITVNLLADGEKVDAIDISASDGWQGDFKDLPKYKDGKEIAYTVTEEEVEYYNEPTISGNVTDGFTITNALDFLSDADTKGTKTWEDDNDAYGTRPESITLHLYADGTEWTSIDVTADENGEWTYNFGDLPKYNDGKEIVYTIVEDKVTDYDSSVDGFDVTNTWTGQRPEDNIDLNIWKEWDDDDDAKGERPDEIVVRLLANGEETGDTVVVKKGNSWEGTFVDLPLSDSDGEAIEYTIIEEDVENYVLASVTQREGGFTLTNKYVKDDTPIKGVATGDSNDMMMLIGLMALSAIALTAVAVRRRKSQ